MKPIDRLIEILSTERGEVAPVLPDDKKGQYFRALCNVREPNPVSDEFIKLQDEYLGNLAVQRGIVGV